MISLDPAAKQTVSHQQVLCLRDLWALLSGQANVLIGWDVGQTRCSVRRISPSCAILYFALLLFFFFLKTNKNQQPKCAWSPVPLSLCRSLHIPSSGSCARARSNPVLLPPSLYLRFTGLILSRGATCVIKNDCYAK